MSNCSTRHLVSHVNEHEHEREHNQASSIHKPYHPIAQMQLLPRTRYPFGQFAGFEWAAFHPIPVSAPPDRTFPSHQLPVSPAGPGQANIRSNGPLARGVTTTTNMVPPFQPGIETSRFGICRPSRLLSEFLPPSPMSTGGVRTAPPVFHKPPPPAFPPSFSFKPLSSNR
ncbi:N-terminal fungal transcription regulatory domain-containing protein [Metarhizium robertsii ARSEF 23]|uniref:N-terminal fungal transcription regulatory domain-containing protein n=1 Tax=Metarhizium robertsii (strain ARSEF 23 / ATCC MYA-3075) TaxID=655844 RepID=E9F1B3_METRA|nr:N-terminal fungal transcription regulatory domain-containing protein [Metarhizium robertsii ARSEF 23]EFY98923.2 N-terminal fungal transcription regulatory domain-containing protein [Metarhizium robertsii ARSEF 23]